MILADYDTKYPLLYASGADFVFAFDAPWYKMTTLIDQGALAPLEDMVNRARLNCSQKSPPSSLASTS